VAQLAPAPTDTVLDLYCGIGNFALALARRAGRVVGVEGDPVLVARARGNAVLNRIGNAEFHTADLTAAGADQPWTTARYDRVLLDPPRAGAREILPLVARCDASCVVYISCHAGSLARDAGILVRDHGFALASAGVMDMFPHTTHVEAMAVFVRQVT
jgi:23S rRNA (uracil1939-C5)-methyltransferase